MDITKHTNKLQTVDIALIQRPFDEGLTKDEINMLFDMLDVDDAIPTEIEGHNAAAMGFQTETVATSKSLAFMWRDIKNILDDVEQESQSGFYTLKEPKLNEQIKLYIGY